jgi:four helix bundle protein
VLKREGFETAARWRGDVFQSFEDLEVWKRSCGLAVKVYEALEGARDHALRDQMQRAAVSIPSNIAESHERGGRDFRRFLRIARGSGAELRTQTYIAGKVGLLPLPLMGEIVRELREISKMLFVLAKSVKNKEKPDPEV